MTLDPSVTAVAAAEIKVHHLVEQLALTPGDPELVVQHSLAESELSLAITHALNRDVDMADVAEHGLDMSEEEAWQLYDRLRKGERENEP